MTSDTLMSRRYFFMAHAPHVVHINMADFERERLAQCDALARAELWAERLNTQWEWNHSHREFPKRHSILELRMLPSSGISALALASRTFTGHERQRILNSPDEARVAKARLAHYARTHGDTSI